MKTITVDKKELIGVLQECLSHIIQTEVDFESEIGLCRPFEQLVEQGYAPQAYYTVKNYLEKIKEA